ncbi:methylated-DNA--[protein]-cysteine S-methyltransferase [Volucribacter amazonae]|uniref:Methylated-DNA--protein-cysteine methyltransferase n=1 Tax=Volucribacter amazonae TaxID=256731 RepID=A0A9X4PB12_9PAST|nr:cysteine methyltransferase [Volucribacter amazonae]
MIYYRYYSSPVGNLLMLAQHNQLTNLDFQLEQSQPNPKWQENTQLPVFIQVQQRLDHYFAGEKVNFHDLPLAPQGTPFQQQVWHVLKHIPYGKTISYAEIANKIHNPKAIRAVGGAVGSNPISILIPCHRVLGKNGTLTGFGGGLPVKRQLLALEQIDYIDKGVEFVKPKLLKKYYE